MQCNKKGFTIVELMIATSIFATISMLTVTIVIGLSKQYQKGTYTVQLNDASRTVHQEIRDGIAYGGAIQLDPSMNTPTVGDIDYFCTGKDMYYWKISRSGSIFNGLYKKQLATTDACDLTKTSGGTNILPPQGIVTAFNIVPQNDIYYISTNFATGTADMFTDNTFTMCLDTLRGGDFCAIVNYNSTVKSRL